jgi:8-oxo-dGTP diphosphatase
MKREQSAGGIIVRSAGGAWDVLIVQDANNAWTFPKGKMDDGETFEEAARREIQEEVGLTDLVMREPLPVIGYVYRRNGLISKSVQYYIFESNGNEPLVSQTEEGIHNAAWTPIEHAINIVGYPKTNKPLLLTVKQWTLHQHRT